MTEQNPLNFQDMISRLERFWASKGCLIWQPYSEKVGAGTANPEAGVPKVRLGTNRWALMNGDTVFDTKKPRGNGPDLSFTTTDTGGCSCEQIIAAQGLGQGHVKFGCSTSAMEDWIALVTNE